MLILKKPTFLILFLTLNAIQIYGQADSWESAREKGEGTLVVLYSENSPFIFKSENDQLKGIEYELLIDFTQYLSETYQTEVTIQWQPVPTFQHLYDSLRYSKRPVLGIASLSTTEDRKSQINLSDTYLPDIEIIVSSNNLPAAANLKQFAEIIRNSTALSVPNSTFEKNINDLKEHYFPDLKIINVPRVDILVDSIASTDNLWGYTSLPNYLNRYRRNNKVVRQRFFMVENEGVAIGGTLISNWHLPFNDYLKTPRFKAKLDELVIAYLGPTFNKLVWSMSESEKDTISAASTEVGMLTLENELQSLQLKQSELELENKNLVLTFSIIGSVFLLIILLVLFLMIRLKSKINRQLSEKNERIAHQAQDLKESYENLKILSDIGQEISSSLSVEKISELTYKSLVGLMDVEVFGIGLYNEKEKVLEFKGVVEKGKKLDQFQYKLSDDLRLAVICFNERKEIVIQNLEEEYHSFLPELPDTLEGEQAAALIYVPLLQGSKRIGVLTVQSFNKNAFSDYQVDMVKNIANYSIAALDNASAYEMISKQAEVLENANQEIHWQNQFIENQNEELLSLNREKSELIGIVAHDLKNPLTSALSVTQSFSLEKDLTEHHREYLFLLRKSLNRMDSLVKRILEIKELEATTLNPSFEDVKLKYILEEAVDNLSVQADRKDISINLELVSTRVSIDPNYTLEVFENLISNAIKFSEIGKSIWIKMSEQGGKSIVEVKDEGPGLTEEDKEKLFRKFQKLSARPTGGETSTGLGLSIVKKYVEAMEGEIRCESEHGKGANFIVSFDIVR